MQTYLPNVDYAASAWVLATPQLDIQRRHNLEILTSLLRGTGNVSHPATLMWRRYEWALMQYQHAICDEYFRRGHEDSYWERSQELYDRYQPRVENKAWPYWSSSEILHLSHRSALLREDYTYYIQNWPGAPLDLEMVFPKPVNDYMDFSGAPWWEPHLEF